MDTGDDSIFNIDISSGAQVVLVLACPVHNPMHTAVCSRSDDLLAIWRMNAHVCLWLQV
jgi:hypothetical protein